MNTLLHDIQERRRMLALVDRATWHKRRKAARRARILLAINTLLVRIGL